jgi:heme-degrading monooxygenase HmoA
MNFQLAQLNIARFELPPEHPDNADFVNSLDRVNEIAESQPGFVWRFTGDGNNAMDVQAFDDPNLVVNMSVWADMDALAAFVYRNEEHLAIMRRRREWFEKIRFHLVLWWIKEGHIPQLDEAKQRLDILAEQGSSREAFTFKDPYSPHGDALTNPVMDIPA